MSKHRTWIRLPLAPQGPQRFRWPVFAFIEAILDGEWVDANSVLISMPMIGGPFHGGGYSLIARPDSGGGGARPEERIGLTMAGFFHCRVSATIDPPLDRMFVTVLDLFIRRRLEHRGSPYEVHEIEVDYGDLVYELATAGVDVTPIGPTGLKALLDLEPPTRGAASRETGEVSWIRSVTRTVLRYEGILTLNEYVARVSALLTPASVPLQRASLPPLGLVATLDFLDTTWRLVHGSPAHLFTHRTGEPAARLAQPVVTADEFASAVGALSAILRTTRGALPTAGSGRGDTPLKPLKMYLEQTLGAGSHTRITDAIDVLHAVISIRDAAQHPSAATKAPPAYRTLGLDPPITDWSAAWEIVQLRTTEALDALREELATLVP